MNAIADGSTIFCLIASIVILIVSQDKLVFNKDYLSILVSSSFTLLGFGLTITAILANNFIKGLKQAKKEKKIDIIIALILP